MIKNIISAIALVFSLAAFVAVMSQKTSKTVYLDMGLIYKNFKLSKELNSDLEKVVNSRRKITDSLYDLAQSKSQFLHQKKVRTDEEINEISRIEEEYVYKQNQFEEENKNATLLYNEQIWKQINQYVMAYGKEKGYRFILGANGQGNIMYGDSESDVTDEITNYLNSKYDGTID